MLERLVRSGMNIARLNFSHGTFGQHAQIIARIRAAARATTRRVAVMTTAGLYATSGDWLFDIGLPGKSGIGGGIVTVSPGKGGLGTFTPPIDSAGNSVKGQLVAKFLSQQLGMDLFVSQPEL